MDTVIQGRFGAPVVADPTEPPTPAHAGPARRVQMRVQLDDLVKLERDLSILQGAIERSLTLVRSAKRLGDPAAAEGIRVHLERANRMLNATSAVREPVAKQKVIAG